MSFLKKETDENKRFSGLVLTGNNSVTEILLWTLIMLPATIVINGAGPCFTDIGIFAGTTFAWLFLVKRIRAYKEITGANIDNMWDYLYSRYSSGVVKNISLFVWLVLIGMIFFGLLIFSGDVVSCLTGLDKKLVIPLIIIVLDLVICFVGNKAQSIIKSILYALMFLCFIAMIIVIFGVHSTSELLDAYGNARLKGGTSIYLNILYYDGEIISVPYIISMLGKGFGCLGLPFLFKGAFQAKNAREQDRGRVLSMIYSGVIIVSSCIWALLIVACVYPLEVNENTRTDELIDVFIMSFINKYDVPSFVKYILLILFAVVVLCLLTTFYSMLIEIFGGFIKNGEIIKKKKTRNIIYIAGIVVISAASVLFVCFNGEDYQTLINIAWEYCQAIASVYVMTAICKGITKAGVISGFICSIAFCTFWMLMPVLDGSTLMNSTYLSAGVASFVFGLAVVIIVSMFTYKHNEKEDKIFAQIKLEQR